MSDMECHNQQIYHTEIGKALHKQQVLECLKGGCQDADILSNAYAKEILARCRHTIPLVSYIKNILPYSIIALTLLFTVFSIFDISPMTLLSKFYVDDNIAESREISELSKAQMELSNGNYDSARTILLDLMEDPNHGYVLPTYAQLCQLEGRHDEAAMVLVNYLTNVSGTQNIQKGNSLYMKLQELTGPFSPDVETALEECIAKCDESIENFNYLQELMELQRYQMVLHFCDSLKQENVTDYQLYEYYFKSYVHLEKYEECAAYFLSLAKAWDDEGESFSFRLPPKSFIQDKLDILKPYVSKATREKIDGAF